MPEIPSGHGQWESIVHGLFASNYELKENRTKKKKNLIPGVHYKLNSLAILIKMELIRFPAMFVYSLIYIVR